MFDLRFLPPDLVADVHRWDELKRWERREIGQTLRRMGLSYREIGAVIPVSKGTLSAWCKDISISSDRMGDLLGRRGRRREIGAILRQRALDRTASIRAGGRSEAAPLSNDPRWVAGVVAYWAEGTKNGRLSIANSDPELICLFISWVETYLAVPRTEMTVQLHLHTGQDDAERKRFWCLTTGIPLDNFRKTFTKPEGTGHRKNLLYNGTASVRVRRGGDALHRVLGWIDGVADIYTGPGYTSAGR